MNVSAASSATDLWKLLQSSQTASTSGISSTTSANGSSSVTSASSDGSSLSSPAKLFSTLDSLSQSNPAEFKKISAQIAAQLQQAAKDPAQADALSSLAANFQNAAKSGNFSDLFSQSGSTSSTSHAGGHHHHYHSGDGDSSSALSSASGTQSTNPLDAIFSNALTQISKDLQTSAATSPASS